VEAVKNGVGGLLCEEKDVEGLAGNLRILLENQQERINFGDSGRKRIVENFNIIEQCKKLESIYNSVSG
jgi:glycosyltransferase involved in cell wall biosynthesis